MNVTPTPIPQYGNAIKAVEETFKASLPDDLERLPNVLLMGPVGTGKTSALRTLAKAGITTFCIFTEPSYEVIEDIGCDKIHMVYIPPAVADWDTLLANAKLVNTYSNDALQKMAGVNKDKYTQIYEVLGVLHNFKCQRCHQEFGDVSTWGTDRAICIDSLSGLNDICKGVVVGAKPILSQPDWGVAMGQENALIKKLCTDTKAMFVLTAHVEKQVDEVLGGMTLVVNALGRKLAPDIPKNFSDVILCKREGTTWLWSTAAIGADVKARNLPYNDKLTPDFEPLIRTWRERRAKAKQK